MQEAKETQDKAEISATKAAAAERIKQAEDIAKAKLAELEKKQTLDAIARDEAAKKSQMDVQVAAQRRAKVIVFCDSKNGKDLVRAIEKKLKTVDEQNAEETKEIAALEKRQEQLVNRMRNPLLSPSKDSPESVALNRDYYNTTLILNEARSKHRDSPELIVLRKELGALLEKFKSECGGIDYDQAAAIQRVGTEKSQ
jgi:hypothetical protein